MVLCLIRFVCMCLFVYVCVFMSIPCIGRVETIDLLVWQHHVRMNAMRFSLFSNFFFLFLLSSCCDENRKQTNDRQSISPRRNTIFCWIVKQSAFIQNLLHLLDLSRFNEFAFRKDREEKIITCVWWCVIELTLDSTHRGMLISSLGVIECQDTQWCNVFF